MHLERLVAEVVSREIPDIVEAADIRFVGFGV